LNQLDLFEWKLHLDFDQELKVILILIDWYLIENVIDQLLQVVAWMTEKKNNRKRCVAQYLWH
jgi:hypothetical protein